MTLTIISRARWGARHPNGFRDAPLPAKEVWAHHSVTLAPDLVWLDADKDGVEDDEERAMRLLEDIGQSRFGGGVSYTWAIMPSGRVYEGHGVGREGAHTKGRNSIARAIVFVGNYETHRPTQAQLESAAELLREAQARGWIDEAKLDGGHQQAPGAQTACPGKFIMGAIGTINKLAAAPAGGGFLVSLNEKEQDTVLTGAHRILGITDQKWWRRNQEGQWVEVDESQRNAPGVSPVPLLDKLDGGYLVGKISDVATATGYVEDRVAHLETQLDEVLALLRTLAGGSR